LTVVTIAETISQKTSGWCLWSTFCKGLHTPHSSGIAHISHFEKHSCKHNIISGFSLYAGTKSQYLYIHLQHKIKKLLPIPLILYLILCRIHTTITFIKKLSHGLLVLNCWVLFSLSWI